MFHALEASYFSGTLQWGPTQIILDIWVGMRLQKSQDYIWLERLCCYDQWAVTRAGCSKVRISYRTDLREWDEVVVGMGCTDLLVPARLQLCAFQSAGLLVLDREAKAMQKSPPRQSQG